MAGAKPTVNSNRANTNAQKRMNSTEELIAMPKDKKFEMVVLSGNNLEDTENDLVTTKRKLITQKDLLGVLKADKSYKNKFIVYQLQNQL